MKCRDCGFLAFDRNWPFKSLQDLRLPKRSDLAGPDGSTQESRRRIADGTYEAPEALTCVRHVWSHFDHEGKQGGEILNLLNSDRKCAYSFSYNPGYYSPAEHKELQREDKTHGVLVSAILLRTGVGGLIGAGAAIVAHLTF